MSKMFRLAILIFLVNPIAAVAAHARACRGRQSFTLEYLGIRCIEDTGQQAVLHGICYDSFFVTGQIYVFNGFRRAPAR